MAKHGSGHWRFQDFGLGDQGERDRKAIQQGIAGGLQPPAGVQGESAWWGLRRNLTNFPRFAQFLIDFSLKFNLKFHKYVYNFYDF